MKTNYLLAAITIATAGFLSACAHDEPVTHTTTTTQESTVSTVPDASTTTTVVH